MVLFTVKYTPNKLAEVLGQDLAVAQLKDFVVNYKQRSKEKGKKAVLLHGPIGTGKTSSVYALAKELGYDLLEINSSDLRNQEAIKTFLSSALGQQSLFFRPKIILIDEIDNLSGVKDRGCIPALLSEIEHSSFPVILTANDIYDSKFKSVRKAALEIQYHELDHKIIAAKLMEVCMTENITFEEKAINSLARQSGGDLRGALIDLQTCSDGNSVFFEDLQSLSDRKRTESILKALMIVLKSSSVDNVLEAFDDVDLDLDQLFFWVDENMPKEYDDKIVGPGSLAKAYEHLARADVFKGRIRRQQHWRFLVYINNLLTAGISSAKDQRNPDFIKYKETMRLLKIWQANIKNAKKKEIAAKLAVVTHISTKVAREQIPYFEIFFKKGSSELIKSLTQELGLEEEEVGWLRG